MSKDLDEAWTTIYHYNDEIIHDMGSEYVENPLKEELDIVNNALLELKAIKEAKPSEALKDLEEIILYLNANEPTGKYCNNIENLKNKLLKAQEQEKVLEILKNKLEFVFFGRTREVKIEQDDSYHYVYLMNGFDDSTLPDEEFDLLKGWLG